MDSVLEGNFFLVIGKFIRCLIACDPYMAWNLCEVRLGSGCFKAEKEILDV
jgi:hypothetical protein